MVKFYKANDDVHKYVAVFDDCHHTAFGALGYEDFTQHGDTKRKQAYIRRHRKNENWNDISTSGAWSRWLLWNKKSITASLADIKRKFF